MAERTTQMLYQWDDPDTRLRYLEMVMHDKSWTANLLLPEDKRSPAEIEQLQKKLESRGYVVNQSHDIFNAPILQVKHLGSDAGLLEAVQDLGLVRGTRKNIDNLGTTLSQTLARAGEYAKHVASDSARMIGAVYLLGDTAVTISPFLNKQTAHQQSTGSGIGNFVREMRDPYNLLQLGQGVSTMLHSVIYMHYAEDGKAVLLSDLERGLKANVNSDPTQINTNNWTALASQQQTLASKADQFMRSHAITAGALVLIAGQVGYISGGFMRFNKWNQSLKALENGTLAADTTAFLEHFNPKEGLNLADKIKLNRNAGLLEMGRGTMSAATWSTFIYNAKEHPDKTAWNENPLRRGFEEFEENPQRAASVMSFLSSGMGMVAGSHKGNHVQKYGEAIYFVADALMFFTKKKHYGSHDAGNDTTMSEAAIALLERAPYAFTPAALDDFIGQLSHYMLSKDPEAKDVETRAKELESTIRAEAVKRSTPYDKMVQAAATLISQFPETMRDSVSADISHALSHHRNVFGKADDIRHDIDAHPARHADPRAAKPDMSSVLPALVSLTYAVPGMDSADTAISLFEIVSKHAHAKPQDRDQLGQMMEQAALQAASRADTTSIAAHMLPAGSISAGASPAR